MVYNGGMATTRPIGFLLRTLDRLIDERFERALGDVTRRQWQLLNTLAGATGATGPDALTAAVAPFLAERETIDGHLRPLEDDGVVERRPDGYVLTGKGRELLADIGHRVQAIRDRTVEGLPDGEYQRTVATLEAMIGNLERDGP